jgi:hypothetical protein
MRLRTVSDVIANLPVDPLPTIPKPSYEYSNRDNRIALAVESFARHMTDEGHQLQCGWEQNQYQLFGHGYPEPRNRTNVESILETENPSVCIVQDRREWDSNRTSCFVKQAEFKNCRFLRFRDDVFRVTVCKDAHSDAVWSKRFHENISAHAWLIYYHPRIACHLASWLRPEHCIRVYHSVDRDDVPEFSADNRRGILLSGAIDLQIYPLRWALRSYWRRNNRNESGVTLRSHPGYNARGSHTPQFLRDLSTFKVSICTSSIFGYSLRKIIESVACGCVTVTNLPIDDVLPEIDDALVRIPNDMPAAEVFNLCRRLELEYDADLRREFARRALEFYDWRASGRRMCNEIESLRKNYNTPNHESKKQ